jgi:hypothetical protein
MDNGLVVSNSPVALDKLRHNLTQHLEGKWQEGVSQIVSPNVWHHSSGIHLKQNLLATRVVSTYHQRTIHQNTPLPNISLTTSNSKPVDTSSFRSVLGSLMYLACGTRPDISFAVRLLARFSNNPSEDHWKALNHLIGYVQKNPRRGVKLKPGSPSVPLYVDARWGGNTNGQPLVLFSSTMATPLLGDPNTKMLLPCTHAQLNMSHSPLPPKILPI